MEDCSEAVISRQARCSSGFSISFPSKLIHVLILRLLPCQELRALVSLENPEILTTSHTQAWNEVRSPHGSSPSLGMPSTFRLNKCNPNLLFPQTTNWFCLLFSYPLKSGEAGWKVLAPSPFAMSFDFWPAFVPAIASQPANAPATQVMIGYSGLIPHQMPPLVVVKLSKY